MIAATPFGHFKLFKVTFGKGGSIYLPFPYPDTKRGAMSETDPETEPDPKKLNLRRNGIVVEYNAKFSHHTSGWGAVLENRGPSRLRSPPLALESAS